MTNAYDTHWRRWRWQVPTLFNIAHECAHRWAHLREAPAVRWEDDQGRHGALSYRDLSAMSLKLAARLKQLGVEPGDKVAVVLHQRPETAIAHMAIYHIGAVAMPLSIQFGPDALTYRLQDSASVAAICDEQAGAAVAAARAVCPALKTLIRLDATAPISEYNATWDALFEGETTAAVESAHPTRADDPAVLIYTSGTTGAPKGVLIPHRALLGNITGFVDSQNGFPCENDVFWSPADWAWTGGLMDALLPTLYFGKTIVAWRGRFSAEQAFRLMEKYQVTNTFLFPTALKMMMKAYPAPRAQFKLSLRAIMSAGEPVGETLWNWCHQALGIVVNEMFGQTEINYVVGNAGHIWPSRPGSMGRAYPGHRVAVIDENGHELPVGEMGDIAVHRYDVHGDPDPVMFLEYWNKPEATAEKFTEDWCRTGDLGHQDADGYLWYAGRSDDLFKAAGYRISPSEIENCLLKHPAVANAAVVPKADDVRGNVIKAFVVLATEQQGDETLQEALKTHIKENLAPYQCPRDIEFIDALPMTTTGKIQRRLLRG